MGSIAEGFGSQVAGVVLEAVDEISGRSNKKWALLLLVAAAGVAIGFIVARRRRAVITDIADDGAPVP